MKGKCVKLSLSHSLTAPKVHVKKEMQKNVLTLKRDITEE